MTNAVVAEVPRLDMDEIEAMIDAGIDMMTEGEDNQQKEDAMTNIEKEDPEVMIEDVKEK